MEVEVSAYSPGSGMLKVKCSGEFGVGTDGNPSGELLTRTIKGWIADHTEKPIAAIEVDYTTVGYSWGDGPVSSMVAFLRQGITRFRLIASSSNCESFKSLLESCTLPWFELVQMDKVGDQAVFTPVPPKPKGARPPF